MREHLPEIGDVGGGLVGRQIGARNGFGLGETALQPDHEREVLPHARIDSAGAPLRGAGSTSASGRFFDRAYERPRFDNTVGSSGTIFNAVR